MKDRAKFWLYAICFVFCLSILANILSSAVSDAAHNHHGLFLVITILLSSSVVVFLALYQHQRLRTERDRELVLLKRVADSWVENLTEMQRFAPGASFIELKCRYLTNSPPDDTVLKIADVFDKSGRSLMIVGSAGSGKTLSLLKLTRHLVNRAIRYPGEPLPVVLSLASWNSNAYKTFDKWLLAELKLTYGLSETLAQTWLVGRRLILLLDGLDEVPAEERASCVTAFEHFRKDFKPPGAVVSWRIQDDHSPLSHSEYFPDLNETIEILDLAPKDIGKYSADGEMALAYGEDTELARLARSPLFLMLILAVDDQALVADLTQKGLLKAFIDKRLSLAQRMGLAEQPDIIRQRLRWLAQGMIKHDQAIFYIEGLQPSWLASQKAYTRISRIVATGLAIIFGWIAILFTHHVLGSFLPEDKVSYGLGFVTEFPLDWMSIAIFVGGSFMTWLDLRSFRKRQLITPVRATTTERIARGDSAAERGDFKRDRKDLAVKVGLCGAVFFVVAMLMGYVIWPSFLHFFPGVKWPWYFPADSLFNWNLANEVSGATVYGISFGLIFWFRGLVKSPRSDIRTAEKLTFELSKLRRGLWFGALVGCLFGVLPAILVGWMGHGWIRGESKWIPGVWFLPIIILIGSIGGGVTNSLGKISVVEKTYPNQGVRVSLRNTILVWLVVGGSAGILIWLYAAIYTFCRMWPGLTFYRAMATNLQDAVFLGSMVGMLFGFAYGGLDVIYHVTLRILLALTTSIPLIRVQHFLDNAASLGFLRRVGGGYMFLHGTLRDQFAISDEDPFASSPPVSVQSEKPNMAGAV